MGVVQQVTGLQWERERQNLSLRELGRLARVQHADIWRIEHGMKPYPAHRERLADALGIEPDNVDRLVSRK